MNESVWQQTLCGELSAISLTEAEKAQIIQHVRNRCVSRPHRLSAAVVVVVILTLLGIGALAWVLAPTIADWFAQRNDPGISSAFLQNSPVASPLYEQQIDDISVIVWEAMTDEKTFVTNTQFQYNGDDDVKLAAFSGMMDEIKPAEGILYVSALSYLGAASNEIYKTVQTDEHMLSILTEGWQLDNLNDTLRIEITLLSAADSKPVKASVEVPVTRLATLESYSLPEPFFFSETGFVLKFFHVVRTELRVYLSYEISGAQRPLASAVRNLEVQVCDANGTRLNTRLSYENPVPETLTLRVVDLDSQEIVEQAQFRLSEHDYLPVDITEEESP